MYNAIGFLLCLFLASCVTKPVFISDIDAQRVMVSNSTHLERIVGGNSRQEVLMGVAVLVGIDEGGKSYVALAPSGINITDLRFVKHSLIRTLDIDQAKELLRVIEFAIKNYDLKVSKLESINANFRSALQSKTLEFQGAILAPIVTDRLSFVFVNIGMGSEAEIDFGGGDNAVGKEKLSKNELELLSSLMGKAIDKIDSQKTD